MMCLVDDAAGPVINPITVFWLVLDQPQTRVQELFEVLSIEEQKKASILQNPLKRNRAIVRLARRRQLASELLDIDQSELRILTRPNGKPYALANRGEVLEISSSNSNGLGLFAVTKGQPIGVDIESISEIPYSAQFASWIAKDSELHEIQALPLSLQRRALLRVWTRKEAYLKATGEGLRTDLKDIEVPIIPKPTDTTFFPVPHGAPWHLFELPSPQPDFEAALVARADSRTGSRPTLTLHYR
jgi:4'-phosphopantetheinyl transferase